jgi:phosphatidylglycerophosphate synthase
MIYDKVFKIPVKEHGVLDRFCLTHFTHPVIDYAKKMNYTPNHLTTCSFFFQGLGVAFLAYDYRWNYTLFYLIGYYFDNVDGPMARKYDMVTEFGDWYDHVTDITCFGAANYLFVFEYNILNNTLLCMLYLMQLCGMFMYTGCQEQIYHKYLKSVIGKEEEVSRTLYLTTQVISDPERQIHYLKPFCITNTVILISLLPHLV